MTQAPPKTSKMTEVPLVLETNQNALDYLNKTKIPPTSLENDQNAPRKTKNFQNTLNTQKKTNTPPKHKK